MQLIGRRDAGIATSLVIATFVLFDRPLEGLFEMAARVERTYNLELVPALTVLVFSFALHQYLRRREVSEEARRVLARAEEVERLLNLGRALSESVGKESIQRELHRLLPTFCGNRKYWLLRRHDRGWLELLGDATAIHDGGSDAAHSTRVVEASLRAKGEAVHVGDDVCFALMVEERAVGILGVGNHPPIDPSELGSLAAASTLIALALNHLEILEDTRRLALRDSLTGCATRYHGLERLQAELRRSYRTGRPVSVLLFDIDDFKTVNDSVGHVGGDLVLEQIGRVLDAVIRTSDVCCRFGGDEFLVVLPDTPAAGAFVVAEKLRESVRRADVPPPLTKVSISIGCATSRHGETGTAPIVSRADTALYQAKREGRDRTRAASEDEDADRLAAGGGGVLALATDD